jgi:HEAT repeat protein
MHFKKGAALTEEQVYKRLQVLKKSLDANLRKKARRELLRSDRRVLNDVLSRVIETADDTELLAYAAELTVETGGEEGAARILPLLHSSDPLLRRHVCGLLSNCGGEHSLIALVDVLENDVSADVRVIAAFALKKIGDQRALPTLKWAKEHDDGVDFEGCLVSDEAGEAIDALLARNHET